MAAQPKKCRWHHDGTFWAFIVSNTLLVLLNAALVILTAMLIKIKKAKCKHIPPPDHAMAKRHRKNVRQGHPRHDLVYDLEITLSLGLV
jgi:hypothetical protein